MISAVDATNITTSSVEMTWHVSEPATGQTQYGTTTSYGLVSTRESSFDYQDHIQAVGGLKPGTLYHFRVVSTDQDGMTSYSSDDTFTTDSGDHPSADAHTDRGADPGADADHGPDADRDADTRPDPDTGPRRCLPARFFDAPLRRHAVDREAGAAVADHRPELRHEDRASQQQRSPRLRSHAAVEQRQQPHSSATRTRRRSTTPAPTHSSMSTSRRTPPGRTSTRASSTARTAARTSSSGWT